MPAEDGAFVVFRTFDDILDGNLFANDLTPAYSLKTHSYEEGSSTSHTICNVACTERDFGLHLFQNQTLSPSSRQLLLHFPGMPNVTKAGMESKDILNEFPKSSFFQPHRNFTPKILQPKFLPSNISNTIVFEVNHSFTNRLSWSIVEKKNAEKLQFITPKQRCVVIVDAYVASSLKTEFLCSHKYFQRFLDNMGHIRGFKDCDLGHEHSMLKTSSDYCSPIGVIIEVYIIWPWQKIDHAW